MLEIRAAGTEDLGVYECEVRLGGRGARAGGWGSCLGESRLVTTIHDHRERGDPRPLLPTVRVEKTGAEEQAPGRAPLVLVTWGHWWRSGEGMG